MRAKFIRGQETSLVSLEIGRVLERKLNQIGSEIDPYLESLSKGYNSSNIQSIIDLDNRSIKRYFSINDEDYNIAPVFYIIYNEDSGFIAGSCISRGEEIKTEVPCQNLDQCLLPLRHFVKYYKRIL